MAVTDYPVNHPLAVKLWSRKLLSEALAQTHCFKFMSTSPGSLCQVFDETQKGSGDRIRVPLSMQLTGAGVGEGTSLEGNEEALVTLYDDLVINDLAHAVRINTTIAAQRVPFKARKVATSRLAEWYADRMDTAFINQLAGNTAEGNVLKTGNQAALAPTSATGNTRIVYADGASTTEGSLSASQTFQLSMLDVAVNIAKTASPLIRPIKVGSEEYYVALLHPNQVRSLRSGSTAAGSWLDIQKAAMSGGDVEDNPIFTGALGVYNGVVLHENKRIPAAPTNSSVRRAVFCGAQAIACGFGQGYGENPKYEEDSFDYGRQFGESVQTIMGMKKLQFSASGGAGGGVVDFGTIVLSTWAPNP